MRRLDSSARDQPGEEEVVENGLPDSRLLSCSNAPPYDEAGLVAGMWGRELEEHVKKHVTALLLQVTLGEPT